jgi:hypothetical protein
MVERVVLHLGLHKTGTTSIQAALVDAFEDLIEHGVLYPRAGRSGPGHALLPEELGYTDGPVTEVPTHVAILEEVRRSRPNTVLISAEDLNRADRPRLLEWARAFCHELSPAHVDLLVYVRPQWEFIEAIYAERTKTGTAWGIFEDFLPFALTAPDFDYLRKLSPWARAFPRRLELRRYPDDLREGDSVADFWNRLGLQAPLPARRRLNPRTGARTTEMLRLLGGILADYHLDDLLPPVAEPKSLPHRRAVIEAMRRAHLRIDAAWPEDRPFAPMNAETAQEVTAHFAASNERLVELDARGRDVGLSRAPADAREPSTWSLAAASEEERRFFAGLVRDTLAELLSVEQEQGSAPGPGPGARCGAGIRPGAQATQDAQAERDRAADSSSEALRTRLGLRHSSSDSRPSGREGPP